jgi:hypothetical protein
MPTLILKREQAIVLRREPASLEGDCVRASKDDG